MLYTMNFLGPLFICAMGWVYEFGLSLLMIGLVIPIHRFEAIPKTEFDVGNLEVPKNYLRSHNRPT